MSDEAHLSNGHHKSFHLDLGLFPHCNHNNRCLMKGLWLISLKDFGTENKYEIMAEKDKDSNIYIICEKNCWVLFFL